MMPSPSSGAKSFRLVSAASTNATSIKADPGTLFTIATFNINAAVRFLKIYDLAVAPTVGTSVPVLTMVLPATAISVLVVNFGMLGMKFDNGIAIALTTGLADADTGAVAANEQVVNLTYL